ncbi:MAG: hypothetical protein KC777_07855 [Cyanobacteria bacterium HKST-UBA02]|nr:hypothetical protein [Cyanobacteria bacterium HKST-UBA02]
MGPKLAVLAVLGILFAWVIVATMPYRRQVIEEYDRKDYFQMVDRQLFQEEANYNALKENPNADKEEVLDSRERLAMLLWEKRDFLKALEHLQKIYEERALIGAGAYNAKFVDSMMRLAGLYRDLSNWKAAEAIYMALLDYDRKFARPGEDIARDKNNLGLLNYLEATGSDDESVRKKLMEDARAKLDEAVTLYEKSKGPDSANVGNTLWNLYLVQRDLGMKAEAAQSKARAEAIDARMNRKCKAP